MKEADVGLAAVTAVVVRSALPAWLRWGWAGLVTVASLGGWVVDHCHGPGPAGDVLRILRATRGAVAAPTPPGRTGPAGELEPMQRGPRAPGG